LLAGCSCLAGDLFGVYSFDEPLDIGSRVVFRNAGAYSIVKANMFNGINLPNIYLLKEKGELVLVKQFTYEDFASRCGVDARAIV
jgi:carboxynorspermidine decarboxylase